MFSLLFFMPLKFFVFFLFFFCLLASLCLASSVSVSLLVFFWKITRSGAVCVHVFCAGYIDWMGWLHWAGFLCGPPANFMIYSAKGRGARPPVTTERELHVGLMISPQKCLLWLGLHGAQSPPTGWMVGRRRWGWGGWKESSADRPESIQTLTTTHLLGGITREEEDGQKATSEWHVPNVLYSRPSTKCSASPACVLLFFITHSAIFLSPSRQPPHPPNLTILVASGRFQRHYWNVDTEDDVTKLSRTGRGAEIIGGGRQGWGGVVAGRGGGIWHIFLCWCPGLLAQESDCWGLGSGCYARCCFSLCLFGYNSPRTRWCHSKGFVSILDKETKSRG